MSEPINDLTGRRFGRLTVLGYSGERGTRLYWKVRCDCGVEKECSGVRFPAGERRTGTGASREKPGEKAATGRRGIRSYAKTHKAGINR